MDPGKIQLWRHGNEITQAWAKPNHGGIFTEVPDHETAFEFALLIEGHGSAPIAMKAYSGGKYLK